MIFTLFKKREFVSYRAKYRDITIEGCATIYSSNQRDCVEQLKRCEKNASGKIPQQIIITARSPY